ncbi:MAG: tripartite tricarboxylate transporter permease, partial [Deltaproteobacteria bacterium]|nr:tripartite tricarboxylate transporter permease [Deltaproteobacteria bacterium]
METIGHLIFGFGVTLQPMNLLCAFLGALMGTLVGVLPGLGPVGAMSMLLPVTYGMPPTGAIIMLAGIYYGAQYGGSTTSILVNIPGESASVVTCLDGYQMARQGRAGAALGISAFGSFIAGTLGVVALSFLAPPLVEAALSFGPPEYFALMCLGLTVLTFLGHGSMLKALILYAILLDYIGFLIVTFLLMVVLLRFIEPQPCKGVIGWALAGSVGSYLIFELWMKLRLPKGLFMILVYSILWRAGSLHYRIGRAPGFHPVDDVHGGFSAQFDFGLDRI